VRRKSDMGKRRQSEGSEVRTGEWRNGKGAMGNGGRAGDKWGGGGRGGGRGGGSVK